MLLHKINVSASYEYEFDALCVGASDFLLPLLFIELDLGAGIRGLEYSHAKKFSVMVTEPPMMPEIELNCQES